MTRKYTITIIAGIAGLALIGFAVVVSGFGKSVLETINKMKPIYRECRIEGKNFHSVQPSDCQNFDTKALNGEIPDGEYTVYTKYVNKALSDNIIPVKIENAQTSCAFIENGYTPSINAVYGKSETGPTAIKDNSEVPVGSDGIVLQINYYKNGLLYFYDTNICKSALHAEIRDADGNLLGEAGLNQKNFITSRPLVNEVLIGSKPYYEKDGLPVEDFKAGNVFARISFAPGITFKLIIPCSAQKTYITMPSLEIDKSTLISFKGLNAEYITNCGSKLYLSLQNTERYDDVQVIDNLKLEPQNNSPITTYKLNLDQIDRVMDPNSAFPISFKMDLNLRDRSDSNQVFTLATSSLTVTGYTSGQDDATADLAGAAPSADPVISESQSTGDLSAEDKNTEKPAQPSRPKVRKPHSFSF
jgi:hypothetical protein